MKPPLTLVPSEDSWKSLLKMKKGEIAQIPHNAYILLKYHPDYAGYIRWNRVSLRMEISGGSLSRFRHIDEENLLITHIQDHLASVHDLSLRRRDEIAQRLYAVAIENAYDPLQNYLNALVWDGMPRIHTWLSRYAGAALTSDNYTQIVGRKWFLSLVARAYQPGCKADLVFVAEGEQGVHKSTMLRILGGPWYCAALGVLGDKDSKQLIGSGAWICELPDMASFSRSGRNQMKAFFSAEVDTYRPPYEKSHVSVPRRVVFFATTNDEDYLGDPTGNRRFLPILLGVIDRAALLRDRDQLFAEAVSLYKAAETCDKCLSADAVVPDERPRCSDHAWWISRQESDLARVHVQLREEVDPWAEEILRFAINPQSSGLSSGNPTVSKPIPLTSGNILTHVLHFDLKNIQKNDDIRIAAILTRAGYRRVRRGRDIVWHLHPPSVPPIP